MGSNAPLTMALPKSSRREAVLRVSLSNLPGIWGTLGQCHAQGADIYRRGDQSHPRTGQGAAPQHTVVRCPSILCLINRNRAAPPRDHTGKRNNEHKRVGQEVCASCPALRSALHDLLHEVPQFLFGLHRGPRGACGASRSWQKKGVSAFSADAPLAVGKMCSSIHLSSSQTRMSIAAARSS